MRRSSAAESGKAGVIFGYLAAIALTVVFALFLSGRTGWFFFSVMLIIPVLSAVTAYVMRRYITVSADISENRLYKGESAVYTLTVENSSYIPAPAVVAELEYPASLESDIPSQVCEINVLPRSSQTASVSFTAKMWYPAGIRIRNIYIRDYTGLLKYSLDIAVPDIEVDIIPDIAELPSAGELIKAVNEASLGEDNEESTDVRALGFTGVPGFEYREYVPGDPIKRINWKLSCRKSSLMVRLDDQIASSKHTFILDRVNSGGDPACGEICGETMLGTVSAVIASGFTADLLYFKNGWQYVQLENENDIEQLRLALAGYRFTEETFPERVPYDTMTEQGIKKSASVIFFSPCFDRELSGKIHSDARTSKTDTAVLTAASSVEEGVEAAGLWLLSEGGNIELIQ